MQSSLPESIFLQKLQPVQMLVYTYHNTNDTEY